MPETYGKDCSSVICRVLYRDYNLTNVSGLGVKTHQHIRFLTDLLFRPKLN